MALHLTDYCLDELIPILDGYLPGKGKLRAKQLYHALYHGRITDLSQLPNLGKDFLALATSSTLQALGSSVIDQFDEDYSSKLAIKLADGGIIESVLLRDRENRLTACLSSQLGCAMQCAFCKTGTLGLGRNLSCGEILEQFLHLERIFGKIDNIVFMGMGEALHNKEALFKALTILSDPQAFGLSLRRITISTCGLVDEIKLLADKFPTIRLAFSLITANAEKRLTLMPTAQRYSLKAIKEALSYYQKNGGKRITLEMVVLNGVNTGKDELEHLVTFSQDLSVMVNLISWNAVDGLPFTSPNAKQIQFLKTQLERHHIPVEVRISKGKLVKGACGQLGDLGALSPHFTKRQSS